MAGPPKLRELLAALAGYRVDFLVVGGVAAVLEGAGRLDPLRSVGPGERTFADLGPRSRLYRIGELEVSVLELSAVIEAKEAADRPKDRAALPLLRRTLEKRRARSRSEDG